MDSADLSEQNHSNSRTNSRILRNQNGRRQPEYGRKTVDLIFSTALILLVILVVSQRAESEEGLGQEINHLLLYIENSGCTFIRNGKAYDAAEARAHIQKKYDYFKGRIKTTENFVKYSATKSSMSGKPYKVRCNGREIFCADWLTVELEKFRSRALGLE